MNEQRKRKMPEHWRRKFMASVSMLLVATLLLGTSSFAWLVLSTAPEVTGLTTNVGANGALEIALLNNETWQDMSKIPTRGGSLAKQNASANNAWGNVVDLSYENYGLQDFILWPSILSAYASGDSYRVHDNLLTVPTYGYDGRIVDLTDDAFSGQYDGKEFVTSLSNPAYGVRAVGTAEQGSAQSAALAYAKQNIKGFMDGARNKASNVLTAEGYGDELLALLIDRTITYSDRDLNTLKDLMSAMQSSLDDIDSAIRQGMIAFAASKIADKDTFENTKTLIANPVNSLKDLKETVQLNYELPDAFVNWIDEFWEMQNALTAARNELNTLSGGEYSWAQFRSPLTKVINIDKMLIGDTYFGTADKMELMNKLQNADAETITLPPESGLLADIANFTGDLRAQMEYFGVTLTFVTLTQQKPVYLLALNEEVQKMTEAGKEEGDESVETESFVMKSTYGYAVDLAFRCNAVGSDLLLQTDPEQRVYSDSESGRTMGGGSYMEFSNLDDSLTLDQRYQLMDAIRVSFVDRSGNLLGIAKLNTSNATVQDGKIKAALYLYSYEYTEGEDGRLVLNMLERQKTNNVITNLVQNEAKAITVVVWLDGDIVDNTMVSATSKTSLNGVLNLQFSSSAELVPGHFKELFEMTSDKAKLDSDIQAEKDAYEKGQQLYTTESWNAYIAAYAYAQAVFNNPGATEAQIYRAQIALAEAKAGLTAATHDALTEAINEIRGITGATTDEVNIVVYDKETDSYITKESYTAEEYENKLGVIYRVDYNNNLKDEGNELKTPIYTDESWEALAAALYAAEHTNLDLYATNQQMDEAISALKAAKDALQRKVFFIPYDYEGTIFYMAVSDEKDTYGKWYDYEFKRVLNELLILKLDAKAKAVAPGTIMQDKVIANNSGYVTPFVDINDEVYPELADMQIIGMRWNLPEHFSLAITPEQTAILSELVAWANSVGKYLTEDEQTPPASGGDTDPDEGEATTPTTEPTTEPTTPATEATVPETQPETTGESSSASGGEDDPSDATEGTETTEPTTESTDATEEPSDKGDEPEGGVVETPEEEEPTGTPNPYYARASGLAAQGQALLDMNGAAPTEKAAEIIQKLALLKAEVEKSEKEEGEESTEPETEKLMNDNQRIVLLAASNAAKAVEGYDSELKTELNDLRAAAKRVDDALASEKTTEAQAEAVLAQLNNELKKLGLTEVTSYNTLQYQIPLSYNTFEVVYAVDNPHSTLVVNGGIGENDIIVYVLTDKGVVFKLTKTVELYSPAGGAEIIVPENIPGGEIIDDTDKNGKPIQRWDGVIDAGESAVFSVNLLDRTQIKYNEDGSVATVIHNKDTDKESVETLVDTVANTEQIVSCAWASGDLDIVDIETDENGNGVLVAVAPGMTTISVTATTAGGNEYAASMTVTVHDVCTEGETAIELDHDKTILATVTDNSADKVVYEFTIENSALAKFEVTTEDVVSEVATVTNEDGMIKIVANDANVGETVVHITAKLMQEILDEEGKGTGEYKLRKVYTKDLDISVIRVKAEGAQLSATKNLIEAGDTIDLLASLKERKDDKLEIEKVESCMWIVLEKDQALNLKPEQFLTANCKLATLSESDNETCTLTAVEPGEVVVAVLIITEYGNQHIAYTPVVIRGAKADHVELNAQAEEVKADKTLSMTVAMTSEKSTHVEKPVKYTWTVSDESIATVIEAAPGSCIVQPVAPGTVQVTVKVETEYNRIYTVVKTITVKKADAENFKLEPVTATIEVGETLDISAILINSKTAYVENAKSCTWTLVNEDLAELSGNGTTRTLKALQPGTVTIIAETETESGKTFKSSAVITIKRAKADTLSIISDADEVRVGETLHLSAILESMKTQYVEKGATYEWSVTPGNIAVLRSVGNDKRDLDAFAVGTVTVKLKVTTEYGNVHTVTKEIEIIK